ncbi:hypothetical protein BDN70DRAFT_939652 [Pholiota conissans]|uniref:Brr2 N-terminal helicase PWI domain-containing protein n=1 Tax=Pholiota conissans TaxID=109636 RepID=A0A9P5YKL9_9AGAR|nr:hypothetical protein BDN70DRAFT_939652 [Pholiota conissans]
MKTFISGEATTKVKAKDIVSPHAVSGFWVQRQISKVFPDSVTAAADAVSILSILSSESSTRNCKNQLMELFDYQNLHFITKFLKNRDAIVLCTKRMQTMLTILNELGKHCNEETAEFDLLDTFKCASVLPMKVVLQEMARNFTARFKVYNVKVGE